MATGRVKPTAFTVLITADRVDDVIPFLLLVFGCLLFRALGALGVAFFANWQHSLRAALAIMFLLTASAHWGRKRIDLVRMIPPAFPGPGAIIAFTGVAEIAGAIGLLWDRTAPFASGGLLLLLIAVFPANVHAARHALTIGGSEVPSLSVRTILQLIFLLATFMAGFGIPNIH
ncbi:MAG: hypothetical protein ACJ74Z_00580 [Bryobacteraceae bacterium]